MCFPSHGGVTPPTSKLRATTEKFLMEKPNNTFCPTWNTNRGPHALEYETKTSHKKNWHQNILSTGKVPKRLAALPRWMAMLFFFKSIYLERGFYPHGYANPMWQCLFSSRGKSQLLGHKNRLSTNRLDNFLKRHTNPSKNNHSLI